ncbi:hypothetical protein [Actinomadura sp. DC4]|uniref:hypothetical protein n=1 Tax=Actinomadura sp. DC4 TaxID=3055069 RepID=UPI0025B1F5D8|nr:hypothetical protein [Actinomadura sp. DC4]MDN3352034.1 hypothetical protein [Actinomadura sp. DC4]
MTLFSSACRMEWIKLRSLRSTWWTLAFTVAGAIGVAVAVGVNTKNASGDLTNNALAGIAPGLLIIGVLGVLTMTSEYSSGMIRATLAAVPARPALLAAKAAVFGLITLVLGEATAFLAFVVGGMALPSRVTPPSFGDPGVLRAVVLSGAGFCLVGLFGLGLGAIIRHSAAALATYAGAVFVAGQLLAVTPSAARWVPLAIVGDSLADSRPTATGLPPWTGLGVLSLYAVVTLAVGAWLLVRRDA